MIEPINYEPFFTAIVAGILYSLIWYSTKYTDPTKPDAKFDYTKMAATAVLGAVVGLAFCVYQLPVSQMSIETQLAVSGAVIAILDKLLKTGYHWIVWKISIRKEGE